MASWSEEIFTVGEAHPFDDAGTILDGTFYEQELQQHYRLSGQTLSRGSCRATSEEGEARQSTSEMEWLPSFIQHLDRCQGGCGVQRVIAARTRCI